MQYTKKKDKTVMTYPFQLKIFILSTFLLSELSSRQEHLPQQ